jgi:hypothetical protein
LLLSLLLDNAFEFFKLLEAYVLPVPRALNHTLIDRGIIVEGAQAVTEWTLNH